MNYDTYIGLDLGTRTGLCIWQRDKHQRNGGRIKVLRTIHAWQVFEQVFERMMQYKDLDAMVHDGDRSKYHALIVFEDARKMKLPRHLTHGGRAQGAGAVKWFCGQFEAFCEYNGFPYLAVKPNPKLTKLSKEKFYQLTGYEHRTSNHARDAAMLVFGR